MFERQRNIIAIHILINLISLYTMTEGIENKIRSTCPEGYHGKLCDKKCPLSCGENGCTRILGKCLNCNETRQDCVNKVATEILTQSKSHQIKKRSKKGCSIGCKKCDFGACMACEKNYYGDECSLQCSETCDGCNRKNGKCSACILGWYNVRKCNRRCSENCRIEAGCEIRTGRCLKCREGWYGDWCEKECDTGFYGDNCELLCPVNCLQCVNISHCTSCRDGWIGLTCQGHHLDRKPPSDSKTVATVVPIVAILVLGAVAAAVVYIIRKRRLNRYETPIHQDDTPLRYMPSIRREDVPLVEIEQDNDGYIRPNSRYINMKEKTKQSIDYRTETPDRNNCDPKESESLLPRRKSDNGQGIDVPEDEARYLRSDEPIYADIDETLMYEDNEEFVGTLPTEKEPDTKSNTPPDTADTDTIPDTSDRVQSTTSDKIPGTASEDMPSTTSEEILDTTSITSPGNEDKVTSDKAPRPSDIPSDTASDKLLNTTPETTSKTVSNTAIDKVPSAALDKLPGSTSDKILGITDKISGAISETTSNKVSNKDIDNVPGVTTNSLPYKAPTTTDKEQNAKENIQGTSSDKSLKKTADKSPEKTPDKVTGITLDKVSPSNVSGVTPDKPPETILNKGTESDNVPEKKLGKHPKTKTAKVPDTEKVEDVTSNKEANKKSDIKTDTKSDKVAKTTSDSSPRTTSDKVAKTTSDSSPRTTSDKIQDDFTNKELKRETLDIKYNTTV